MPFGTSTSYAQLLADYLDARALEPSDFPEGLAPTNFPQLLSERGYNARLAAGRPFIFLTYLGPDGEPYYLPTDSAKENPYSLARFLGAESTWKGDEPPPKMIAQNGRPNVLHYEPLRHGEHVGKSWSDLPDDTIVVHVESMIKARAVHRWTGLPCIGLNGVASSSSSKRGVRFLYEDQPIDFGKFHNVVLFDSNIWKKPVRDSREKLLFNFKHVLGCKRVGFVDLPKTITGEDQGPDDYLRADPRSPQLLYDMLVKPEEYKGDDFPELLSKMNERAVFCSKGVTVIDRQEKIIRTMTGAKYAYRNENEKIVGKGGVVKTVYGFEVWLDSPHRTEVHNPAYKYLNDEFVTRFGRTYYNTYLKSGAWPSENDMRVSADHILRHLRSIMKESDLELLRSYVKFLKFTDGKPTSFPVLFGDARGVGKGWFGKFSRRFMGDTNCTEADARAFVSNFNAQIANRRLVVINEFKVLGEPAKAAAMNSLKRFMGDEFITVEPKGVDSYEVENDAGMIITSNALEDVPTDGLGDRRMWYIECVAPDYEPNWTLLHDSLDEDSVMASLYDWVAGGQDINFSTWRPPLDEARVRAIRRSSTGLADAAIVSLEDAKSLGLIVVDYETLKTVLREQIPKIDENPPRNVSAALVKAGWIKSEKRYGKTPATQRHYYIADDAKFAEIEHSGKLVLEAASKAMIDWIGGGATKFDTEK